MKKLLMVICVLVGFSGCYNDKYDQLYPAVSTTTCDTASVSYLRDVKPIITANCAISGGCHDAAGAATSGFDYSGSISVIQSAAANGTLLKDINWVARANPMPKGTAKLPDCDINKITGWVNQGARDN